MSDEVGEIKVGPEGNAYVECPRCHQRYVASSGLHMLKVNAYFTGKAVCDECIAEEAE